MMNKTNFEIYNYSAREFVKYYSDSDLRALLLSEEFDIELSVLLLKLLTSLIEIEEYMYCAHIRDYFVRYRDNIDEFLKDE